MNQKKINWKVRFKNKIWLASFCSLIIGFVFSMLRLFDIYPEITEDRVTMTVNNVLTFLGLFGVLADPTTQGLFDSERALTYEEPWSDDKHTQDVDDGSSEIPEDKEEEDPNGEVESTEEESTSEN